MEDRDLFVASVEAICNSIDREDLRQIGELIGKMKNEYADWQLIILRHEYRLQLKSFA